MTRKAPNASKVMLPYRPNLAVAASGPFYGMGTDCRRTRNALDAAAERFNGSPEPGRRLVLGFCRAAAHAGKRHNRRDADDSHDRFVGHG